METGWEKEAEGEREGKGKWMERNWGRRKIAKAFVR